MLALPVARMTSGASATSSFACLPNFAGLAPRPPNVDPHIVAIGPAQLLKCLPESGEIGLLVSVCCCVHQHADAPQALWLLRPHHQRPRRSATD